MNGPATRAAFAVALALVTPRVALAAPPEVPANPQVYDPYDVPLAPRPPTLPELTHPDYETSGETTLGFITPNPLKATNYDASEVAVVVQRLGGEVPLDRRRRFYLGGSYEIAAGSPPGGGAFRLVPSNLDLYGRVVWATRTGLTFGGGVGTLLPTAHFDSGGDAAKVASGAQAVRPWDDAFFLDNAWTFRGFVDVRDVVGRFVIQFREGLEYSVSLSGNQPQVAAIAQVYLGYRVLPLLGVGLEAFETYLIQSSSIVTVAQDHARATFTVSPSVRLMTPYVQPDLGFVTSIGDPLFGSGRIDGFWALRIGASVVWDPSAKVVRRGNAAVAP
jgi:hypothetical protein